MVLLEFNLEEAPFLCRAIVLLESNLGTNALEELMYNATKGGKQQAAHIKGKYAGRGRPIREACLMCCRSFVSFSHESMLLAKGIPLRAEQGRQVEAHRGAAFSQDA
eukprot:1160373-Pelagomonas_calceolata.AAC.14